MNRTESPDWLKSWQIFLEVKSSPSHPKPPRMSEKIKNQVQRDLKKEKIFSRKRIWTILFLSVLSLVLAYFMSSLRS